MSELPPSTAAAPALTTRPRARPRIGLSVELRTTSPGAMTYPVLPDPYIRVLAGTPVRVSCHAGGVRTVSTRGDIDLMPAGMSDQWFEDDAGRYVHLRLPTSLLRQAAEEM